jgi:hypothetical protein
MRAMSGYRRLKPGMTAALVGAAFVLHAAAARAGPCTSEIAQLETAVRSSGLTAPQSVGAQLGHEPTPASIERSEARLKASFAALMARAKRYDAHGNRLGCTRELAKAKRMYVP